MVTMLISLIVKLIIRRNCVSSLLKNAYIASFLIWQKEQLHQKD